MAGGIIGILIGLGLTIFVTNQYDFTLHMTIGNVIRESSYRDW
jgi:hypothetical protein